MFFLLNKNTAGSSLLVHADSAVDIRYGYFYIKITHLAVCYQKTVFTKGYLCGTAK